MSSDRRFFKKTMKSLRKSDAKIRRVLGVAAMDGALVTDLAPRKADKDIFECHSATRGLADERIVRCWSTSLSGAPVANTLP